MSDKCAFGSEYSMILLKAFSSSPRKSMTNNFHANLSIIKHTKCGLKNSPVQEDYLLLDFK